MQAKRIRADGGINVDIRQYSVETALFELLGVAEGDKFKRVLEIVK